MNASGTNGALDSLAAIRIIPVVVIDDAAKAPDVAAALVEGGIGCAEITLRTPDGLAAIKATAGVGDFVVGAGTVLSAEQVEACVDAGARFIVSPGFDDDVVAAAQAHGIDVLPGVATASEIQRAVRAGLEVVKFFPADRLGGLSTIAALAAPFTNVRFVPSGGVSPGNAREYLEHPAIHSISGSWMASRATIAAGDFESIARLAREAVALTRP
ncbi:MAG TPA: bifunctional 4-hydroxy-2-oxoglutarate aldolase/2-dehydro-3-deoxy-phosphogluconate aldolase [Galbitalea sp.]|jgi:2-dehydro-3-deoxyphosphogluconate aldolase/(4S)-4-hydroxy-2-oxoglutarate aldolase|nr:bifunctional 4-hydroxy-2-oxoglutarate aldolase/2-dehydro-3-deoxy-phosphogluconate aldolase [Galbitalea sp.]